MDSRLTKLETRLETILPTLATKGDMAEMKTDFIKVMLAALALAVGILIFAINRAAPPSAPATSPPVVVYPQVVMPQPAQVPVQQAPQSTKR